MRPRTVAFAAIVAVVSQAASAIDLVGAWRAAQKGDFEYSAAQSAGAAGRARRAQADNLWNPSLALSAMAGLGFAGTATSGARFSAPGFGQSNGVSFNASSPRPKTAFYWATCRSTTPMLPCNVSVQEHAPGRVEVSAIDPIESMKAVENSALGGVATEVHTRLKRVIETL